MIRFTLQKIKGGLTTLNDLRKEGTYTIWEAQKYLDKSNSVKDLFKQLEDEITEAEATAAERLESMELLTSQVSSLQKELDEYKSVRFNKDKTKAYVVAKDLNSQGESGKKVLIDPNKYTPITGDDTYKKRLQDAKEDALKPKPETPFMVSYYKDSNTYRLINLVTGVASDYCGTIAKMLAEAYKYNK